jgi:hypothetical protein
VEQLVVENVADHVEWDEEDPDEEETGDTLSALPSMGARGSIKVPTRSRKLSVLSTNALSKLSLYEQKLNKFEKQCANAARQLRDSATHANFELKARLLNDLGQLNGLLEKLHFTEIDSVVTQELSSGKTEAREQRKLLNKRADLLHERIIQTAKIKPVRSISQRYPYQFVVRYVVADEQKQVVLGGRTKEDRQACCGALRSLHYLFCYMQSCKQYQTPVLPALVNSLLENASAWQSVGSTGMSRPPGMDGFHSHGGPIEGPPPALSKGQQTEPSQTARCPCKRP